MMEPITRHSITRAAEEAVKLWALAGAQYPKQHDLTLDFAEGIIIETVSTFALNARRALEVLPSNQKFQLTKELWRSPPSDDEIVRDLWDALNRIIHAQKLDVLFTDLRKPRAVFIEGSQVVSYVQAETDQKKLALIDPFALSYAFLHEALPQLVAMDQNCREINKE